MNYEMVKSKMVVVTGRDKADMSDADVAVSWMLNAGAGFC
jgi:hypothetical protein